MQNFPGAPNGARKDLKQLMLGLFRREAANFFWGIFAKNPEIQSNGRKNPPLLFPILQQGGGVSPIWVDRVANGRETHKNVLQPHCQHFHDVWKTFRKHSDITVSVNCKNVDVRNSNITLRAGWSVK